MVRHGDGSYTTSVHIKPYLEDSDGLGEHGLFEMGGGGPGAEDQGQGQACTVTPRAHQ